MLTPRWRLSQARGVPWRRRRDPLASTPGRQWTRWARPCGTALCVSMVATFGKFCKHGAAASFSVLFPSAPSRIARLQGDGHPGTASRRYCSVNDRIFFETASSKQPLSLRDMIQNKTKIDLISSTGSGPRGETLAAGLADEDCVAVVRAVAVEADLENQFRSFSQCFDVRARLVRYAFLLQPLCALLPSPTCMLWCVALITGLFSSRVAPLTFAVLAAAPPWLLGLCPKCVCAGVGLGAWCGRRVCVQEARVVCAFVNGTVRSWWCVARTRRLTFVMDR